MEKDDEEWMVRWDQGEKANPKVGGACLASYPARKSTDCCLMFVLQNWTVAYRWYITAAASLLVLNSTFASSAPCERQS